MKLSNKDKIINFSTLPITNMETFDIVVKMVDTVVKDYLSDKNKLSFNELIYTKYNNSFYVQSTSNNINYYISIFNNRLIISNMPIEKINMLIHIINRFKRELYCNSISYGKNKHNTELKFDKLSDDMNIDYVSFNCFNDTALYNDKICEDGVYLSMEHLPASDDGSLDWRDLKYFINGPTYNSSWVKFDNGYIIYIGKNSHIQKIYDYYKSPSKVFTELIKLFNLNDRYVIDSYELK